MDVQKLEVTGNEDFEIKFLVKDTIPAYMNTLRRVIMLDVPTLAIHKIIVHQNTSAMFDEYIAHRLGLVPIWSDIDYIETTDSCEFCGGESPDGCSHCTVELALQVETDKANERMVTTKELISRDSEYYPIHEDIPIIKMGPDQRLELDAIARFGRGREHAKFCPVGTIGYQYMPSITIGSTSEKNPQLASLCPRGVFKIEGGKLVIDDVMKCNLCNICVKETKGDIQVDGNPNEIIFTAESTGVLYIEDIVLTAIAIIEHKADNFLAKMQEALEQLEG